MEKIILNGDNLTLEQFDKVVNKNFKIEISKEACERINKSREIVENILKKGETVYGINTGFGELSKVTINNEDLEKLQRNLIISHSCGVGNLLKENIVKGIMLLRINALCKGYSGIRLSTVEMLKEMLNKGVIPNVPEQGSVGASGDLAPLSHIVLVMLGLGEARYKGKVYSGEEALRKAGLKPISLAAKEGLALINGTQVMTSIGAVTLIESIKLTKLADIIGAMTLDALKGTDSAFIQELHKIRAHKGQNDSARNLYNLLQGSEIKLSHENCSEVQDAYTLRCMPIVHGASRDAIEHIKEKLIIEFNSVTDNPIIFDFGAVSGGNFHGQPIALAMDYLGIALAELANISERRIERMTNPNLSNGLPAFLIEKSGLNSGFMIAQYTAASLVSENKVLAHPASVDSIPTSANKEDHVSMGTIAARKAFQIMENVKKVLAVELLCAAQAIDLRKPYKTSPILERFHKKIREKISFIEEDVIMYEYINNSINFLNEFENFDEMNVI